eukprot:GHRR01020701.1.p1 GENE.GHRR01020701.1~~GHRR01020701.1.p1  ORF type:complete len:161 (-),score=13.83 GHRR01020701.1:484-966(-)
MLSCSEILAQGCGRIQMVSRHCSGKPKCLHCKEQGDKHCSNTASSLERVCCKLHALHACSPLACHHMPLCLSGSLNIYNHRMHAAGIGLAPHQSWATCCFCACLVVVEPNLPTAGCLSAHTTATSCPQTSRSSSVLQIQFPNNQYHHAGLQLGTVQGIAV